MVRLFWILNRTCLHSIALTMLSFPSISCLLFILAISSWVEHEQQLRTVNFTENSLEQLKKLETNYLYYNSFDEMKTVIQQVLSADVSKRSDRRVSEFEFDCLSILFSAQENSITIEEIVLTSEYQKVKQQSIESLL